MKRFRFLSWFQPARPSQAASALPFQPRLEALEERCVPATLTVLNANDSGRGSLRAAILQANRAKGDTILFSPTLRGATIDLQSGLVLSKNMTILGPGSANLTLSRDSNDPFSVFTISPLVQASLTGLSISNGYAPIMGGAIDNQGTVSLTDIILADNQAPSGGALANELGCTATLASCSILNNAGTSGSGGGVYNGGTLTISNSTISGNSVEQGGRGGGIENQGTLTLTGSTVSSNTTTAGPGGGIDNHGTLLLTGSIVSSNTTTSGPGGGIYNLGSLTLAGSAIQDNIATAGAGGGIFTGGTLTISASTISGNRAEQDAQGGGVADLGNGSVTVTNSTIANNQAFSNGPFSAGGGGFYIAAAPQSTITLLNSTVAYNAAVASDKTVGATGGGLDIVSGLVTLDNTIVAENASPQHADVAGSVFSASHSLFSSVFKGKTVDFQIQTSTANLYSATPGLGALQDNGGPTQTVALLANSPAIGMGDSSLITHPPVGSPLTSDQTGRNREINKTVDIGAYEYQPPETTLTLSSQAFSRSRTFTAVVQATAKGSNEVGGSVIFYVDGQERATVALSDGKAQWSASGLGTGHHTVLAYYEPSATGDYFFDPSQASVTV